MAEGGASAVSKDAFSKASGDADEIFCDPCLNGGKSVAVDGYCQICEEYMCSNCIELHRNQKISRSHAISDKSQMPTRTDTRVSPDVCTLVCSLHHPEIVRFYCKTHDETGCVDCMTLNHATCTKERIQDIANGFQATREFKQLNQKLDSFLNNLDEMKDSLSEKISHIGTPFETIEQKIESFREEFNAYLDDIQKKLADEVDALRKEEEIPLKQLSMKNDTLKSEVETIIQNLQSCDNINSSFVLAKQTHKRLVALQKEFGNIQQTKRKQQQPKHLDFHPSSEITKILSSKAPFGKIARRSDLSVQHLSAVDRLTATYLRSINLKSNKDGVCFINGCTLVGPTRMVVTDGDNCKVKLIDLELNRIMHTYKASSAPGGLTTISEDQVAVALPNEATILVINVTRTLIEHHEIKLKRSDGACWAIAYKDGIFAVSYFNEGRIDIYDALGNVLHTLQPKDGSKDILPSVRGIQFGPGCATVIVSDFDSNKICVVSFEGEVLQTYTHDKLILPCRISVTKEGLLLICSHGNGSIHAVNNDLTTGRAIITDMPTGPACLTFCETNQRIYISCKHMEDDHHVLDRRNNELHVYELKTT